MLWVLSDFQCHPFQRSRQGREKGSPFPSLALCTEQVRNQQQYERCASFASGTCVFQRLACRLTEIGAAAAIFHVNTIFAARKKPKMERRRRRDSSSDEQDVLLRSRMMHLAMQTVTSSLSSRNLSVLDLMNSVSEILVAAAKPSSGNGTSRCTL
jgi:hypothetical protein